jgi:tRNA A37 threonylcarbamoyladenosine dehydratase
VNDSSLDPHLAVVDRLAESTVVVIGIGGVGSWAAEALCRSGVGNLILVDLDDICISNTNRQLHATSSTTGKRKIDEMKRRLLDINPDCNVTNIHDFVSAPTEFKPIPTT